MPEITKYCPNTPFILLATKADLRYDSETIDRLAKKQQQLISYEEGEEMAKQIGATAFAECSALTQSGMYDAFKKVYQAVPVMKRKTTREKISNFFSFKWGNYTL